MTATSNQLLKISLGALQVLHAVGGLFKYCMLRVAPSNCKLWVAPHVVGGPFKTACCGWPLQNCMLWVGSIKLHVVGGSFKTACCGWAL